MDSLIHMPPPTIMLQVQPGVWINALEVASVTVIEPNSVTVTMTTGKEIYASAVNMLSAAERAAEIVDYINHAALIYIGKAPERGPNFIHRI